MKTRRADDLQDTTQDIVILGEAVYPDHQRRHVALVIIYIYL